MAGILLENVIGLPSPMLIAFCILISILLVGYWKSQQRLWFLLLLCLLLGGWRARSASPYEDPQALARLVNPRNPLKIQLHGTVSEEPKVQGQARRLIIEVSEISLNNGRRWLSAHGEIEVQTRGLLFEDPYAPNYGDSVQISGKLQAPQPDSQMTIQASMAFPRIQVQAHGGNPVLGTLYHLRILLATTITQDLPQPEAALMIAILLGLRTPALAPFSPAFNVTGTAHLIVPSGFKVTILSGLVGTVTNHLPGQVPQHRYLPGQLQQRTRRQLLQTGLIVLSIAVYTVVSGAGPAALRAGIMGILLVLAPRLNRQYSIYTALGASAILISLQEPFVLWDAGFQRSQIGTLGIVLLTPTMQRLLHPLTRWPLGNHLSEIIAVTMAAQIATLPIFMISFHQLSFIAPIANLLTVPLLGICILQGICVCLAGLIHQNPGILCGWMAWPVLWYILKIVQICAKLPGAYIELDTFSAPLAWSYYGVLGLCTFWLLWRWPKKDAQKQHDQSLILRRVWRLAQVGASGLAILSTGVFAALDHGPEQVTISFLRVGAVGKPPQGEAILIRTPDKKTVLIDGGNDPASLAEALNTQFPPWQHNLDLVILTAPGQEELNGLIDIVSRYRVGAAVDMGMLHPSQNYTLWRHQLAQSGIPYLKVSQGMNWQIGRYMQFQVLSPKGQLHKSSQEAEDNALILRLHTVSTDLMLLGEAAYSTTAMQTLLTQTSSEIVQSSIIQYVDHPNKTFPQSLRNLLQMVHPSLLLVTPAVPHKSKIIDPKLQQDTSNALTYFETDQSIQVLRTASNGTIHILINSAGWKLISNDRDGSL